VYSEYENATVLIDRGGMGLSTSKCL
jgi:hypothetical protein